MLANLTVYCRLLHTPCWTWAWYWVKCNSVGRCPELSAPRTGLDVASRPDLRRNRRLFRGSADDYALGAPGARKAPSVLHQLSLSRPNPRFRVLFSMQCKAS